MPLLPPLTVAVPLFAAAVLAGVGGLLPRRFVPIIALVASAATVGIQIVALLQSWPHHLVHWFGGWSVVHHFAVGIVFTVDPVSGSLAATVGILVLAALVYSEIALDDVSHTYYVLMLAFLAGMSGFSLSGDLFDIFVFFELMSVCGYALCSFRNTSRTVLHGALDFAIINTIGAFFVLAGIALIYARTGALNLAEIARQLQGHRPDSLVVVSFVLIVVGFLVKAGAVPFHFWLSDAYAVAAAPVGAVYAGIMSDLGYHVIARVYAQGFAGSIRGDLAPGLRELLVGVGSVTVVVAAVMCFLQADLKRMLAFLVVSQGGVFLCGIGQLNPAGIAGSTMGVVAAGFGKAAVFLVVGYIVATLGSGDELRLRGRGKGERHRIAALVFGLGALGLSALPGTGSWAALSLTQHAAQANGYTWLPPVLAFGTALSVGALLRAGCRVFLGWGPAQDPSLTSQQPDEPDEGEPKEQRDSVVVSRWALIPATALVVVCLGMAAPSELWGYALHAGRDFLDLPSYLAEILHDRPPAAPPHLPVFSPSAGNWILGSLTTAGAVLAAAFGLWWTRIPSGGRRALTALRPAVVGLKRVHSVRVGDMATWLALGSVSLCAAAVGILR